jgi:hypothetical protein
MIDREARDELIGLIEGFLDERISAWTFESQGAAIKTSDPAVTESVGWLSHICDEAIDHPSRLPKSDWDFIQRLLLLLRSDAELVRSPAKWVWSWRRVAPVLPLLAAPFVSTTFIHPPDFDDMGSRVALAVYLCSIVSTVLVLWLGFDSPEEELWHRTLRPFRSSADVLALRRAVPRFQKRRYRGSREAVERSVAYVTTCFLAMLGLALAPCCIPLAALPGCLTLREREVYVAVQRPNAAAG